MSEPKPPLTPRKVPKQARSRATVDAIVEAAARVFRREGWDATTNRIAEVAGVSIGSLYEYFPNKESILLAIAERHLLVAETGIAAALDLDDAVDDGLAAVQAAIVASHRFPSQALELVRDVPRVGPALLARAEALRARVLDRLRARATAAGHADADVRALAAFEAIGPATARARYLHPNEAEALAAHYLRMARTCLEG